MPGGAYELPRASEEVQPRIAATVQESPAATRVVVPIGDRAGRPDRPGAGARVDDQILLQILEQAARRGATTVYVVAQSRPMVRVEGEISPLENIPALSAADIERLVATLSPGRSSNALADGQEWISEVPQVGRVRCVTFKDHRGPGLIFRISSTLAISADHLNLPPAIRELSMQSDGLVIVTGARGSGKSTLLNSFVDLINSTRSDHMITVESEIAFVHESRKSFVSQREVPENHSVRAAAVSAALREDPDVLVIEDVQSSDVARAALEGAASGRLVFISMTAPSSGGAIDGLIDMLPAESRAQARAGLASTLRGVVGQVLLRRSAGGRTTARELLLNAPAVSAMIKQGRSAELVREQQNGQRFGMIPLAESLSALVRSGAVHPAEAYRRAPDRAALLAVLAREGVDTSFAERLA
jgi:twitching motility protein PilT